MPAHTGGVRQQQLECGSVLVWYSVIQWRVGFGLQASRIEFQSGLFTLWPGFKTQGQGWAVASIPNSLNTQHIY